MELIFRRLWMNNILNKVIGKIGFVCFINVLFEYQESCKLSKIVKEDFFAPIYLECSPEDVKKTQMYTLNLQQWMVKVPAKVMYLNV